MCVFVSICVFISDFPECEAKEFTCDSKLCLDENLQCDGKPDCTLGEDERNCGKIVDTLLFL